MNMYNEYSHQYIKKYNALYLYLKDTLSNRLFEHCERVAELSFHLAIRFDISTEQAWLAGMCHDTCREYCTEDMYDIAKEIQNFEVLKEYADIYFQSRLEDILYHGPAAAVYLYKHYTLDFVLAKSICSHTLGHPDIEPLGKILYVADTLEPNRKLWKETVRKKIISEYTLDEQIFEVVKTLNIKYNGTHRITKKMIENIKGNINEE